MIISQIYTNIAQSYVICYKVRQRGEGAPIRHEGNKHAWKILFNSLGSLARCLRSLPKVHHCHKIRRIRRPQSLPRVHQGTEDTAFRFRSHLLRQSTTQGNPRTLQSGYPP